MLRPADGSSVPSLREAKMENRGTVLEPIRRAYAARDRGDLDDLLAAFHPEAEFTLVGDRQALAVAGSAQGHRGLREALGGFIATFQFVEREILSELVEGDRAAVHCRLVVQYNPTRERRTTECLDLLKFQDGKIIELIEFADTAVVRDMMSGATA
jgi:ketosteroid isomerase-like protein